MFWGKLRVQTLELGLGAWLLVKCLLTAQAQESKFEVRAPAPPCTSCTGKAEMGGSSGHASLNQEVSGSGRDGLKG